MPGLPGEEAEWPFRKSLVGLACMFACALLYVGTNMLTKPLKYSLAIPVISLVLVASPRSTFRINCGSVHIT